MIFIEAENVELKRMLNDSFEKALNAFLNTMDGTIYIGVNDDGSLIGVGNIDDTLKKISDIITTQVVPNPQEFIEIGTKYIEGKHIIEIKIKRGNALYYIKKYGRSGNGCYIRVGTTCRSMTEEQIERRYIESINIPEKTMKDVESPRQDLTFKQFKTLLTFKNIHYKEQTFEVNFNLRNGNNKYNYIAFLVSDQNDTSIKVVRFNGKTKSDFISRKEFENGCIFKQMEDALEYSLNVLNIIQTNIVGGERVDTPYFDAVAFREAWFNAVCHNLWVERIPPAIYGYDDRVEIISQGKLKKGMTQDEFFMGISKPINDEFAKIFTQLRYMEQSGRGVPTIVEKYGKDVYHFGSSFIQCVLPYNIIDKEKQQRLTGNGLDGQENEPQNLESEPQNLENEPQNLEGEPQNEPQNLENEPQNLESEPQNEPQNLENEPQNLEGEPQNEPQNLENEPQNLEGEPQNEPQNLENEPQNLESEPQNLESEPQNFGNKPQNTYEDLNKTTAQVLNVIKENNIATKEDIALQLNKSVSTVKRCISILRDNGYIEYVGVSKNGSWKILK